MIDPYFKHQERYAKNYDNNKYISKMSDMRVQTRSCIEEAEIRTTVQHRELFVKFANTKRRDNKYGGFDEWSYGTTRKQRRLAAQLKRVRK